MFKDLRAQTKFAILCGVCLLLTSAATYALLVEKQIAISFARGELVGSRYLALLRPIYVTVLKTQAGADVGDVQSGPGSNHSIYYRGQVPKLLALCIQRIL